MSEISSSSLYYESPLSETTCDLCDPDFAKSKLSYRGRRSRRLCKILTFPLHSPLLMLLSLVESIISCFGRTFSAPHHLGGYIELLPFVTLWIQSERQLLTITLRIQGPNKSTAKSMKRRPVKGRSRNAQLQILF